MNYLELEDFLQAAGRTLGARPAIRDIGLIESALARPPASAFGEEAYPTLHLKAAALLQSLARNHPLVDGNKRSAMMATEVFLGFNGWRLSMTNDDFFDLAIAVATGALDHVEEIAARLERGSEPR